MAYSLIVPVFAFRTLAQIDSSVASQRASSGLVGLAVISVIVFVALTGLLVWLARPTEPPEADRDRRPLVPSAWGLPRGIDPDAAAAKSGPRPRHIATRIDEASSRDRHSSPGVPTATK